MREPLVTCETINVCFYDLREETQIRMMMRTFGAFRSFDFIPLWTRPSRI
jgi:hypothetical protein